jgi:starvation-inducible DNA-binding protein
MLAELRDDNVRLGASIRETHGLCEDHSDVGTASFLEGWIDETEKRVWFLDKLTR